MAVRVAWRHLLAVAILVIATSACALSSSATVARPSPAAPPPTTTPATTATSHPPVPSPSPPSPGTVDGLPGIIVSAPQAGATVSSPVRIAGTASVFEGTVHVRIVDATGRTIGRGVGTASQGAPGRGTFGIEVTYSGSGAGVIEVYSPSPRDGAELFLVRIPVTLR